MRGKPHRRAGAHPAADRLDRSVRVPGHCLPRTPFKQRPAAVDAIAVPPVATMIDRRRGGRRPALQDAGSVRPGGGRSAEADPYAPDGMGSRRPQPCPGRSRLSLDDRRPVGRATACSSRHRSPQNPHPGHRTRTPPIVARSSRRPAAPVDAATSELPRCIGPGRHAVPSMPHRAQGVPTAPSRLPARRAVRLRPGDCAGSRRWRCAPAAAPPRPRARQGFLARSASS